MRLLIDYINTSHILILQQNILLDRKSEKTINKANSENVIALTFRQLF